MSWRSTGALAYHTRRCVGEARVSATKGVDVPATPKVSVTKDGLVDSSTPTVVVPVRRVAQVDHTKEKISNVSVTEPADGAERARVSDKRSYRPGPQTGSASGNPMTMPRAAVELTTRVADALMAPYRAFVLSSIVWGGNPEAVCDAVLERVPVGDGVDDAVGVTVVDADPVALGVSDPLWLMDAVPEEVAALLGV